MLIPIAAASGGIIGWLVGLVWLGNRGKSSSVAVGVFGALLGLVTQLWLRGTTLSGSTLISNLPAAIVGATLLLVLWTIAQRLFLAKPQAVRESES
ncbi:MAG: hypothetical protein RH917_03385 [Lacipirellulaceae bacterium]